MRRVVDNELATLRRWTYPALADAVKTTCRERNHIHQAEGVAADGTRYVVEVDVFWDDRANGDIRVCVNLWAEPQRKVLGFLPVYTPNCSADFIMNPSGRFVGEDDADSTG